MTFALLRSRLACWTIALLPCAPAVAAGAQHAAPDAVRATAPDGLDALLSRVRAAVGVDALAARAAPLRAAGTASIAEVDGAWSFTMAADGTTMQRIDGDLDYGIAVQGSRVWILDLGGEVREAFAIDREGQLLGNLVFDNGWLREGGPLELTLARAGGTDENPVLAFSLRGGRLDGRIEIDRATHLPVAWHFGEGQAATTISLGDWKEFEGARFPHSIATRSPTGFDGGVTVDSIGTFDGDVASLVPPSAAVDVRFDASVPPAIEVVRAPTGHLLVHPRVNGKDVGWFLFDTGAGMNVLTASVIDELALTRFGSVPASGVGGITESHFVRPATLSLGPATLESPLMVGLDLSFLDQHMGRKIAGLVGFSFLARTVVELDLETPSIAVHDPRSFAGDGLAWHALHLDQRIPQVEASFGLPAPADGSRGATSHRGFFRLDTGAAQVTVSMHEPAVRELKLLDGLETTDGRMGGVGGFVSVKKGTLEWFELGGRRSESVPAEFALEAKGAFADPYALGNIGGKLLAPFVLVFDYPRSRIAFVPRP